MEASAVRRRETPASAFAALEDPAMPAPLAAIEDIDRLPILNQDDQGDLGADLRLNEMEDLLRRRRATSSQDTLASRASSGGS